MHILYFILHFFEQFIRMLSYKDEKYRKFFTKAYKDLATYRSENNFVGPAK